MLAQTGSTPVSGLDDVPLWIDFVDADDELYGVVSALTSGSEMGLSLFLPPDVPQDRVDYLRDILDEAMNDPDLIAEAEERNIPLPEYGDWAFVQAQVAAGREQPQEVQDWFRAAVEAD